MTKKKGFTLIELLVVIAIIALLLSIVMPALRKAKEMGRRMICLSLLRSFATANMTYSTDNDGKFVPFSQYDENNLGPFGQWDARWPENMEYRTNLTLDARVKVEDNGWEDPYIFPKELMCPSHKVEFTEAYLLEVEAELGWQTRMSYAMNTEKWVGSSTDDLVGWYPSDGIYRGHSLQEMTAPSARLMFIDSNLYQTRYERANFLDYWDDYGDVLLFANFAQVAYRHSEGASAAFFDGHAGFMKKEEVYNVNNPVPRYNPTDRLFESLWDIK